jgi:hypothetical protein
VPYSFVRLPVHSYPPPQVEDYASVYWSLRLVISTFLK